MSEPAKPKSTLDLLKESRELVLRDLELLTEKVNNLKTELKRLDKAVQQWEPKE